MLVNIMRDEISITEKIQLLSKKSVNLENFSTLDVSIKKNHAYPRLVTKTNKQNKIFYHLPNLPGMKRNIMQ